MSRIDDTFARCKAEGRAALVGYLTAFDPDRSGSLARILAACDAGLDILELGVPFSDPTADGPDVQGAMVRALRAGATVAGALELAGAIRERFSGPIVLFSYANPLLRRGPEVLAREAASRGVDALLVVDLPPEHAATVHDPARAEGLDWISLVAPTTTQERLGVALARASGFVYAVTLRGVTGAALDVEAPDLPEQLQRIRARTSLPVVAGFGIRTASQASAVASHADGVVVGSALVRAGTEGSEALAAKVAELRRAVEAR